MPSGTRPTVLLGSSAVGLVRAVHRLANAPVGPYAIVGGVAVTVRLGEAHRATADVDTVVQDDRSPLAIDVLKRLPGAEPDPDVAHRVYVDGTKIEVLPVGVIEHDEDLEGIPDKDALFVGGHAWALATGSEIEVVAAEDPDRRVFARFATPGALVAMKLHAIEDRSFTSGVDKRAGDGWDLFRILVDLDGAGAVREEFAEALPTLRRLTLDAAERILVTQAARTSGWMRSGDGAMGEVSAGELRAVGEPFCAALRGSLG